MIIGESTQLQVSISPSNATDKTVLWGSSKQSVATVSNSGLVSAIAEGNTTITATAGGISATCLVTVSKGVVAVASLSLNKTDLVLVKGQSETLTATVNPNDATDKTVIWNSSNTAVATVNSTGKVTAVSGGSASITAKAGEKQATCAITVTVPVESVSLDRENITLEEENSTTLVATVKPNDATDKAVTWDSSNTSIATVDQSGKVKAVKEGSSRISARVGDKQATCSVTVKKQVIAVTSVTLNKTVLSLDKGQAETLTATVKPDDATDKTVAWSSSNTSIVTVDQSGKVIAVNEGSATITAKAGEKRATCSVAVKKNVIAVTSVALNKTELSLIKGQSETLTVTVKPDDATDKTITWSSSNINVATVDGGKVIAVGGGNTTITAKAGDKQATCAVSVTVPVESITLNNTSVTLKEGESLTLTATISPKDATDKKIIWTSSANSIATVDSSGKVIGIKEGSTTITATTMDGGKKAICSIIVETNLAPSVTVEADHISTVSAVLHGKANLGSTTAADLQVGFQYSESAGILPSNSKTIEATDADASYNYTTTLTGLDPATKYYFRSFVRQNSQYTYGEVKEFTTKDITSMLETKEATNVKASSAVLHAKLDLTDVEYKSIYYGFEYADATMSTSIIQGEDFADKSYSATLTNLSHNTQYWYRAYVQLDYRMFLGEKKEFTTGVVSVKSVSLDKKEYTFNTIGNTLTLIATVLPAEATDKSVFWSSDNENVATVNTSGKVTAVGNGTATITVITNDQGKTASCVITVAQQVTSITLNKTSITLNVDEEQVLSPTVNPTTAADKSLKWTSSNKSVATVDPEGKVAAISKGTATIKAEAKDGSGKYATCSVTVNRLVTSITLNKTSLILHKGESDVTETLTATVTPLDANNRSITWTSDNTSVATVSSSGEVTGKSKGTATITVTAKDGNGAQATCEVEVRQYVTSITLPPSLSLEEGQIEALYATVNPFNANNQTLQWSSSDITVATVDNTGKVNAKAKGKVTIKVTANDGSGASASCEVVVSSPCPSGAVDMGTKTADGYKLYWATCNIGASNPEDYGDYYAWGEIEPYYSSQNPLTWKKGKKNGYHWASYKWANGAADKLTKYCPSSKTNYWDGEGAPDGKTVLDPEDDVAHVVLGGNWRMPTDEEWTELSTTCTWTWTSNFNGTGVKGRIVTASNGNSIFLPYTGQRDDTVLRFEGSYGMYWSSSSYSSRPDIARCFSLSDINGDYKVGGYNRCKGHAVRPISE